MSFGVYDGTFSRSLQACMCSPKAQSRTTERELFVRVDEFEVRNNLTSSEYVCVCVCVCASVCVCGGGGCVRASVWV